MVQRPVTVNATDIHRVYLKETASRNSPDDKTSLCPLTSSLSPQDTLQHSAILFFSVLLKRSISSSLLYSIYSALLSGFPVNRTICGIFISVIWSVWPTDITKASRCSTEALCGALAPSSSPVAVCFGRGFWLQAQLCKRNARLNPELNSAGLGFTTFPPSRTLWLFREGVMGRHVAQSSIS